MKTTICTLRRAICAANVLCITFIPFVFEVKAQTTVQIGGSDVWYNTNVPIEPFYSYSYSQSIITSSELQGAGLQAGSEITALIYEYTNTALTNSDLWDVFIGYTAKNSFADVNDWEDHGSLQPFAINAFPAINPGSSPFGVSDVRIAADIPFVWDGVSNIIIAIDENSPNYGSSTDDFYCHETSKSTLVYYSDFTNPDPNFLPAASYVKDYNANLRVVATNLTCVGLPFTMNFENGSLWSTNWSVTSGSTPSTATGPTDATVFGSDPTSNSSSSNYAFCEASAGGPTIFTMTSGCFDFSSVLLPKASFAYHAYGSDMGTMSFQFSPDGISWLDLWSVSGQQHTSGSDPATVVNVNMTPTASMPEVYFRFYYVKGSSFNGDMSIDDVVIDQDLAWVGLTSDWHNTDNWSTGTLPDSASDVTFPSSSPNQPEISNDAGMVRNITIESGAKLTISQEQQLNVFGNWTNNGTIDTDNGLVNFTGTSQNILNGGFQNFYSIRVSNPAGIEFQTGTYNIYGALYPDGGTIVTKDNLVIASDAIATGRIMATPNQCTTAKTFELSLADSYGDGWNGASLDVYIDGAFSNSYAVPSGSSYDDSFTLSCGSDVSFNFTSGSWDTEITYTITVDGVLDYSGGPYGANTGNSASGIYTNSNPFITPFDGDVIVEQYLSTSINGWREFTSSVQSMTLEDFNNDGIPMSGFAGAATTFPSFTSVYTYDESNANGNKNNGWVAATNITNPMLPSSATRIYTGTGPYNVVLTGTPGYGDYTHNLSYENSLPAEIAAAEDQKGWNFVGNPYPCPISWDQLSKVNVDDQIWIYSAEAGNYGIYTGGTGSGGGTNSVGREIAANQGVWVHANATGASVTITEAAKQDVATGFVKSQEESPFFKVRLSNSSNSFYDEVILGLDNSATAGYDPGKDGYKMFTSVTHAPSLWMEGGSMPLSLNRISTFNGVSIDLHYSSSVFGTHKLLFTNPGVLNFDGCLVLEDLESNSFTPIADSLEYSFNSNPLMASGVRFKLHYYPISEVTVTDVTCSGSHNGSIHVGFGGEPPFSATLTSATAITEVFNDSIGIFDHLSVGTYQVEIGGGKGCANEQFQVELRNPSELVVSNDLVNPSPGDCDGLIRVDAMGGTPPYTYYINGIAGQVADSLCSGVYTVAVVDFNGCSYDSELALGSVTTVIEDDFGSPGFFKIVPNPSNGQFIIYSDKNVNLRIYSSMGQLVRDCAVNGSKEIDISDLSKGVYHIKDMETGSVTEVVLF